MASSSEISNVYNWPHQTSPVPTPSSCSSSSTSSSHCSNSTIPSHLSSLSTSLSDMISSTHENNEEKKGEEINEIWRTIDNYCLYRIEKKKNKRISMKNLKLTQMTSLYINRNNPKYQMILTGSILPNPSCSSYPPLQVKVVVFNYAIDFGDSPTDRNRGLWLMGAENVWYKLENPHPSYSDIADECLALCAQYLNFYDAIVHGAQSGKPLINLNQSSHKYDCDYNIKAVYRKSQFHFDINILRSNCKFFYETSLPIFWPSCTMMKDLQVRSEDVIIFHFKKLIDNDSGVYDFQLEKG